MAGARVFAMMTGDYPNIGDALIRERVFAWVRKATDAADVYVGSAPQQWMERLGVRDVDRVYSTRQVGPSRSPAQVEEASAGGRARGA